MFSMGWKVSCIFNYFYICRINKKFIKKKKNYKNQIFSFGYFLNSEIVFGFAPLG